MSDQKSADQKPGERPLDPEKLLRIASLAREVLEEVRRMDPDDHTAAELAALHKRVTAQLHDALTPELAEELQAIDLNTCFDGGVTSQEVRIAYSALIGWLGGLFQGLQAAMQVQALQAAVQSPRSLEPGPEPEETPQDKGRYL